MKSVSVCFVKSLQHLNYYWIKALVYKFNRLYKNLFKILSYKCQTSDLGIFKFEKV